MKKDQKEGKSAKKNMLGLRPLGDRVVVKEIDEESAEKTTKSGIIIPVTVSDDKGAKRGEVVAIGPGRFEEGSVIPMTVTVGDEVLYSWGDKVKIDGEDYTIVRESEVIAIIK